MIFLLKCLAVCSIIICSGDTVDVSLGCCLDMFTVAEPACLSESLSRLD